MISITNPIEMQTYHNFIIGLLTQADCVQISTFGLYNSTESSCKNLYNELVNRNFTFINKQLDSALTEISQSGFYGNSGRRVHKNAKILADYITLFAQECGLTWDDANTTTYEMDAYKSTVLGKALFEAGLFENSKPGQKNQRGVAKQSGQNQQASAGSKPTSTYKNAGPQSGFVKGLVGTPGQPQRINAGGLMYNIEADKLGKNTPKAYIHPVDNPAVGEYANVASGGDPAVNFGSGNGYTDLTCYFKNVSDATTFMQQLLSTNKCAKYANVRIAKSKARPTGYYEVKSEFGNVYVALTKLNEELASTDTEMLAEAKNDENISGQINNIDIYSEWFNASIS